MVCIHAWVGACVHLLVCPQWLSSTLTWILDGKSLFYAVVHCSHKHFIFMIIARISLMCGFYWTTVTKRQNQTHLHSVGYSPLCWNIHVEIWFILIEHLSHVKWGEPYFDFINFKCPLIFTPNDKIRIRIQCLSKNNPNISVCLFYLSLKHFFTFLDIIMEEVRS